MINTIWKSTGAACALMVAIAVGLLGCKESEPKTKDYMVVVNRPNHLHVVDLHEQKIIKSCQLPGSSAPGTVMMAPDNTIAYVLANRFGSLYGVNIDNCNIIFEADLSNGVVRGRSIASLSVSKDGSELYTVVNPVKILNDHYEVQHPEFRVYNTADGRGAEAERVFEVPRQINIMATGFDGMVYLSGPDVYEIDPKTGEYSVKIASRSAPRPLHSPHDILTVWPIGNVSNEFVRMYSAAKFTDDTFNMDTAEFLWGFEKIDLTTGKTEVQDFGPLEEVLFSGMHRPGHPDEFYAALTQLKRHKVSERKVIKAVDLERSYYAINFSTDGSKIYLGGTYNDIAVYDAETLEKISNIDLPGGDMSMSTPQIFSITKEG